MAVEFLHALRDPGRVVWGLRCLVEVVHECCCFEDCLLGFDEKFPALCDMSVFMRLRWDMEGLTSGYGVTKRGSYTLKTGGCVG